MKLCLFTICSRWNQDLMSMVVISCIIFSCQQDHKNLSGRWVSTDILEGRDYALMEIDDSIINLNKHSIHFAEIYSLYRDGTIALPIGYMGLPTSSNYTIAGDTLYILDENNEWDRYHSSVFFRVSEDTLVEESIFQFLEIDINMPPLERGVSRSDLSACYQLADLNVGYFKKNSLLHQPDTTMVIQVHDVIVHLDDLDAWVSVLLDQLDEHKELAICLNLDSKIPDKLYLPLMVKLNRMPYEFDLFKAGFQKDSLEIYYTQVK